MKRVKVIVEWSKRHRCWIASQGKKLLGIASVDRAGIVHLARNYCRNLWRMKGQPSELQIRNRRTGEWSAEGSTYGRDPKRSRG